jgi:two-component system, OmpR family, alkaline phosphatase synthesis response regulator PhoP
MMTKTILVVDDDKNIRTILKQSFQCLGYRVITAENGEEGERKAKDERPSLVILDVMMPVKNGFDACRGIKRDPETDRIPVILLTAKDQRADIVSGHDCGADAYVTKPYSPVHLEALVKELIEEAEEGRQNQAWTGLPRARKVREEFDARLDAGGEAYLARLSFAPVAREGYIEKYGRARYRDLLHAVAWRLNGAVREISAAAVLGQDEDDSFLLLIHPDEAERMESNLTEAATLGVRDHYDPSDLEGAAGDRPDPAAGAPPKLPLLRLLWSREET